MKKSRVFIVASMLVLAFCAISCLDKKDLKFDNLEFKERVYLFPLNDTTMPYSNVEIEYKYPEKFKGQSKEDLSRLQQIFNGTFFNDTSYDSYSPKEALNKYIEDYTEVYRELGNQYYGDMENLEGENQPSWYWHQLQKSNEILFEDENILSYSVQHSDYTGGAHGSLNVLYYTIDLNEIKTITEESIFKPNYFKFLTAQIVEKLMEKYKLDTPDKLIEEGFFDINEIAPNNNFWINDKGVHYIYNQYEIAPYSMGPIDVTIPYEDIKSIIIPESIAGKYIN